MSRLHILCVDDDETVLNSLEAELDEPFGSDYELSYEQSPAAALDFVHSIKEDGEELALIIADYIMPQMKGDRVLEQVHQVFPSAKKIMLTGQSSTQGVVNAVNKADLYRYLEKPWEHIDFILTVREALTTYEQEQQLVTQHEELAVMNVTLEQKVKARTSELEKKSKMLENANTQVSKAFEQLEKSQIRLIQAERMASHNALIMNISQAFQDPVNLIGNGIDVLKLTWEEINTSYQFEKDEEFEELQEDFESTLGDMKESVEQMHKTTIGLQNFSQDSDNRFRLFDLHVGINSILLILKERWKGTVTISKDFDERLSEIECIPNQINQAFMNLIENSLEAIQGKGQISISTKREGAYAAFTFCDNGKGIPVHLKESIFLPFVTTKPNENHSGTGLAVAREIVEKHHGSLEMKELEEGEMNTCFVVKLPREQPKTNKKKS